jgi:hypothetical protein
VAKQMPDFEVNEGYIEAGRRRADSPRPAPRADGLPADARTGADGRSSADAEGHAREDSAEAEGQTSSSSRGAVGEGRKLPEETPMVRRVRHLAYGHRVAGEPKRRVGVEMIARRRRLARRACPYGWKVRVLGTPVRKRRHLWTLCHGQLRPSGSPS